MNHKYKWVSFFYEKKKGSSVTYKKKIKQKIIQDLNEKKKRKERKKEKKKKGFTITKTKEYCISSFINHQSAAFQGRLRTVSMNLS